jgi:hypothetical protein
MSIQEQMDRAAPIIDHINDAAAAMEAGATASHAGHAALNAGATATSAVKHVASGVVDAVGSIVPDLSPADLETGKSFVDDAQRNVSEGFYAFASSSREYGAAIQSRLSESLNKQPLLLGAIGLAIGAGIASAFATTEVENQLMGEKGAAARENLKHIAEEAKSRARQVVAEVQDEAARQGLSLNAAKDAAASVAGKVRNVADTAREAVTQPFKSPTRHTGLGDSAS